MFCGSSFRNVVIILFPIYIGVNESAQLEADNTKSVNPTDKVDTLGERRQVWQQLWKISLFLSKVCGWERH